MVVVVLVELTSTLKVEYEGKEISLSEVRNFSSDNDPEVRRKGYEAEMKAYPKIAPSVAYALNGVKGEVNMLCELRGFESALDQAVYQSRMERSTLDALIESMNRLMCKLIFYSQIAVLLCGR